MKKALLLICAIFLMTAVAYAAQDGIRKATGELVKITAENVVIKRGKGEMVIARDASTNVAGNLKVGEKVTVEYKMIATSVAVKDKTTAKTKKSTKNK
jgi:RNase P/RNase MRP subunit p29